MFHFISKRILYVWHTECEGRLPIFKLNKVMKQLIILLSAIVLVSSCTSQSDEKQNEAAFDTSQVSDFNFETIGELQENNTKLVNQIKVSPKGKNGVFQTLDGFVADVQANEEVIIEDLNFDGIPDIRLMQFAPIEESITFFYWLYDANQGKFIRNTELEEQVLSPAVDLENQQLISQWRKKDGSYGADYFEFSDTHKIKLVKKESNVPHESTKYLKRIEELNNGVFVVIAENVFEPQTRLPF